MISMAGSASKPACRTRALLPQQQSWTELKWSCQGCRELPQQRGSKSLLLGAGMRMHVVGSAPSVTQHADPVVQPMLGRAPCVSCHLLQQVSSLQRRAWLLLLHGQQHHVQAGLAGLLGSAAPAACRPRGQARPAHAGVVSMEVPTLSKAVTWQRCAGARQTDALCQPGPCSLQVLDRGWSALDDRGPAEGKALSQSGPR